MRRRVQALIGAVALTVVLLAVGVLSASANPLLSFGPLDVGDTYTLTYTASDGGTIDGDSLQTVLWGASGTPVTAVPDTGYHFVKWSDNGTENPRTDTNVQADISVTATFAVNSYTLTYTAGSHGSISGDTPQTVDYGENGTAVTAVPNTGYHFVQWSDGKTANPRTDKNVTDDISVTASFAVNSYTLTYTAGSHGSIAGDTPQTVDYGADGSAVTAVPNTGYHFVKWSDNSTENPRTDTNVQADINVTATFAVDTFTLAYAAGDHGAISGKATQTVDYGADGSAVTAAPDIGYHFVKWSDNSTENPRTDTNVQADISVTASFAVNSYTLTYTAGSHGSISGDSSQTVDYGADGSAVTAVPNTGYHFVKWSDNSTENPRTDTGVTKDIAVTASFAIDTFTLTYTPGAHGSLTGDTSQTVDYGGDGTPVTAVPATGYHFVKWSDDVATATRTDTNVTAPVDVTATFAIDTVTLTYTAGAHGSLTGDTSQTVDYGGDGTPVTAMPATGYKFMDWSDGRTDNPRSDLNVTKDVTVAASFADTAPPVVGATFNGTVGNGGWYTRTGTATITATDADGVSRIDWLLDGAGGSKTLTPYSSPATAQVTIATEGTHTLQSWATDGVANEATPSATTIDIDATAPNTTQKGADDATHSDWVQVTFKATDSLSGVAYTEYSLDGGGWTKDSTGQGLWIKPLDTPQTHTILYRSADVAGNLEDYKTATVKTAAVAPEDLLPHTTASSTTPRWNSAWQNADVVVTLTGVGDAFGLDFTEYSLDGGDTWTQGNEATIAAPSDHSNDGRHALLYRSYDKNTPPGVEPNRKAVVAIDTAPPATTATGGSGWHNHDVKVMLTGRDRPPANRPGIATSGVGKTEYTLDGGQSWWEGNWAVVPALRDHSKDGAHTVGFRSTDLAGNVERMKTTVVHIDTQRPTTVARYAASVRRYRYVTLSYRVKDPKPTCGKAKVTIRVKTLSGRTVKTLKPGLKPVNTALRWRFRCGLARGTYRFMVYATDRAGNRQVVVGVNRLRVY